MLSFVILADAVLSVERDGFWVMYLGVALGLLVSIVLDFEVCRYEFV